ncbi:RNA polymerase [Cuevavirus lloviuense]|uniref:RNA polymerase n=1 Tax=Cuevavirus lloviuense TaxID=3052148 RepID=A0ACD3VMI8_9MONO|nr:RNA polymerase [Cuevavirus lloviuense]UKR35334.1 RNA polymerase [Cuevavirus lloviuense]UKS50420.1 RNA-dependent RNA polymerase [Cuevavirus lloviuense]WJL97495.1 RNA-dependent RNA polymerase [Cuevavirus lloviuense]
MQEAQYPDARLSSPIVLDQCDLVARACNLYSNYSYNPTLKKCRLPKHIYRLQYDIAVNEFLAGVPLSTLPIDYLVPLIINANTDSIKIQDQPSIKNHIKDGISFALHDSGFLNYYLKTIGINTMIDLGTFHNSAKKILLNERIIDEAVTWLDLVVAARRARMNRGNTRSTWYASGELIDILGYGDYIFWKIPLKLLPLNKRGVPHASAPWYDPTTFKSCSEGSTVVVSISTVEVLLMIKDVAFSRMNTLLICKLAELEDTLTDYPTVESLHDLYRSGDYLISLLGSTGYDIIKYLEPLCLGRIQLLSNFTPRKTWYYSQMQVALLKDLAERTKGRELTLYQQTKIRSFHQILFRLKLRAQQWCELFSIQKHWGHPVLHSELAIAKVKKHGTCLKVLRPSIMFDTFCVFKYMVGKHHFDNTGHWYRVTHDKNLTPTLKTYIQKNHFPTFRDVRKFLWEFYLVQHEDLFSTKVISDLSIFIKDRATAVESICWDAVFEPNVLGYAPPMRFITKRVPEQFLAQEDFSLEAVISYAEKLQYLEPVNRNFSFSLKEKELNIGRTFGKLPYLTRNLQTLCEALLADGLAKAFPSNMMVVTEREQKETLLHQASWHHEQGNLGDHVQVRGASFVTDLEKYNLAFRFEFTRPFIEYCNHCYNIKNAFNWMHYLIPSCYMHVSDYYNPPHGLTLENRGYPPEGPSSYRGHLGGIEGLQQKLWTSISCAQISLAELRSGFKTRSAVMGDNQCITVLSVFPDHYQEDLQELEAEDNAARVAAILARITASCGIFLKPEETFVHSGFIYFGKKQYLNGVQLPQSLKTAARMAPLSDAIFDDLQGTLASIGTAFERAIAESRHIFPIRIMAAIQSYLAVKVLQENHLGFPKNTDLGVLALGKPISAKMIRLCLSIPQVLGGLSFLNPEKCFYRNLSDPVTSGLYQVKKYLAYIGQGDLFPLFVAKRPGDASAIDLVLNPLGLNYPGAQDLTSFLRRIVRQSITFHSKNKLINSLFHANADLEDEYLCEWLLSSEPVMSRFAADIFSRTPSGKRLQILGYLEGTRTLLASRNLHTNSESSLLSRLRALTTKRWQLWFSYMDQYDEDLGDVIRQLTCTLDIANVLREYSWSHVLQGRRLIGATLPCVPEQFELTWLTGDKACKHCQSKLRGKKKPYVSAALVDKIISQRPSYHRLSWTIGTLTPYIGSRTEDKIGQSAFKPRCPSAALRETIELASRILWVTQGSSQAEDIIRPFCEARINLPVQELFKLLPSHYSGNIVHRYNDQYGPRSFMANRMSNTATRIIVSTNTLGPYSGGGQAARDSNIIFQNVINFAVAVLDIQNSFLDQPMSEFKHIHLHIKDCCTREVPSQYLTYKANFGMNLQKYQSNELIYDKDPLRCGLTCRVSVENFFLKHHFKNSVEGELLRYPHLSAWGLANTVMTSLLADMNNASTDLISGNEVKSFTSQFLAYPLIGIFYSFGAITTFKLGRNLSLQKITKSQIIYYLDSQLYNLPHRALRVFKTTFQHPAVLESLLTIDPSFSFFLGGASGGKSVADATRLFLRLAIQVFLNFISLYSQQKIGKTLPLWVVFPLEGEPDEPILEFLSELLRALSHPLPDQEASTDTRIQPSCVFRSEQIYRSMSTMSNFFHASLACWRDRRQGRARGSSNVKGTILLYDIKGLLSLGWKDCSLSNAPLKNSLSSSHCSRDILEHRSRNITECPPLLSRRTRISQELKHAQNIVQNTQHVRSATLPGDAPPDPSHRPGCLRLNVFKTEQDETGLSTEETIEQLLARLKMMPDTTSYCRFTGVIASMHYKLDEVLYPTNETPTVALLAEGEGSGALLLIRKYRARQIFFNTLATGNMVEAEVLMGESVPRMLLPLLPSINNKEIKIFFNTSVTMKTDITDPKWFDSIEDRLPRSLDLLVMDAETIGNSIRIPLYNAVIKCIDRDKMQDKPKCVIVKLFLNDYLGTCWILNHITLRYNKVEIIKPLSSNARSSEWYLKAEQPVLSSELNYINVNWEGHTTKLIKKALHCQLSRQSYWVTHLMSYANLDLHREYIRMGFPPLTSVLHYRYHMVATESSPLLTIRRHTNLLLQEIRELVRDYFLSRCTRTQAFHFIKTQKGRITKLANDYLKWRLVLSALERYTLFEQALNNIEPYIQVCILGPCNKALCSNDHLPIPLLYLTRTDQAERKLLNRLVGLVQFFPDGL